MIKLVSVRKSPMEDHMRSVGIEPIIIPVPRLPKGAPLSVKFKNKFMGKIIEHKPDVLFILKDPGITPAMLSSLRKKNPKMKVVMWFGDQRGNIVEPLVKSRRGLLDALLITNNAPEQISMYKKSGIKNVYTFYHSFSIDEFKLWSIPATYDVFFGGSNFNIRKFPLSKLRRNFIYAVHRNFKTVVHGGGWNFPTEKWILRPKYAKALRKGKINLGMNHYHILRYYNRRLFESVGSGRLHITYYIPGMEKHFKNRKHLVWFKTPKQGIDLIRYYLRHEKEREKIARDGRDFFINQHSWPVRIKQFKTILDKIL